MQSENYEEEISKISKSLSKIENEISSLIKALTNASDTPAQKYITENINNLDTEKNKLLQRKAEIEGLLKSQDLSQIDFDNLKNSALSFSKGFDKMDIEQKREALRTLVDKIVWDGEKVHIYLFGSNGDKSTSSTTDILETKCEDSK